MVCLASSTTWLRLVLPNLMTPPTRAIAEDARTWFQIRDLGLEVVGGYLSPVTDAYMKKVRWRTACNFTVGPWATAFVSRYHRHPPHYPPTQGPCLGHPSDGNVQAGGRGLGLDQCRRLGGRQGRIPAHSGNRPPETWPDAHARPHMSTHTHDTQHARTTNSRGPTPNWWWCGQPSRF